MLSMGTCSWGLGIRAVEQGWGYKCSVELGQERSMGMATQPTTTRNGKVTCIVPYTKGKEILIVIWAEIWEQWLYRNHTEWIGNKESDQEGYSSHSDFTSYGRSSICHMTTWSSCRVMLLFIPLVLLKNWFDKNGSGVVYTLLIHNKVYTQLIIR